MRGRAQDAVSNIIALVLIVWFWFWFCCLFVLLGWLVGLFCFGLVFFSGFYKSCKGF